MGENMGRKKMLAVLVMAAAAAGLCGCSRKVLNYQVAECIGTLEKYENNEPVETPKMKAEREKKESESALEAEKTDALETAAALALEYRYEEAVACLKDTKVLEDDERAKEAIADYEQQLGSMYEYSGTVGHLSFTNLVMDVSMAFDGDENAKNYRETMITYNEFEAILKTLHENGYVLVDLHDVTEKSVDASGDAVLEQKNLVLPKGRKPLVISVDNPNYASVHNGDGVATKLALDENGEVQAVLSDAGGHEKLGAYDVIPVLEQFIDENPDFSFRGARGIIGLSGSNGAFGYRIEEGSSVDYKENAELVKQIADKLKQNGWTFASMGYHYDWMNNMSYETLKEEIMNWKSSVGSLIGECDTLIYPYGAEVDYASEKAAFLMGQGFCYLIGSWPDGDHLEVNTNYLRQTRRMVTGYIFENYPNNYDPYFVTSAVKDTSR